MMNCRTAIKEYPKRLETFLLERDEIIYKTLICFFFIFFISQILFIAKFTVPNGPDETRHVFISKIYKNSPFVIPFEDKREYARFMPETPATPYLYHVAMGWLLHLNVFEIGDKGFLRMINALLSIVFYIYLTLLFIKILKDRYAVLICLALSTNIFMLVYLWGSVSYDNFANLFAIISFYYFLCFMKEEDFLSLLLLAIFVGCGSLTKFTFLPLTLFFITMTLTKLWKTNLSRMVIEGFQPPGKALKVAPLLFLAIILLALNIAHFGSNIIKYKSIKPSVSTVRGESRALDLISKRNFKLRNTPHKPELVSFPKFALKWIWTSNMRTFGVCSHKTLYIGGKRLRVISVFLIVCLLVFLYKIPYLARDRIDGYLLLCCLAYGLLVFFNNYLLYKQYHIFGVALQGRYLFPVFFVFAALVCKYVTLKFQARSKLLLLIVVFCLFFANGIYYFITNANSSWFV